MVFIKGLLTLSVALLIISCGGKSNKAQKSDIVNPVTIYAVDVNVADKQQTNDPVYKVIHNKGEWRSNDYTTALKALNTRVH